MIDPANRSQRSRRRQLRWLTWLIAALGGGSCFWLLHELGARAVLQGLRTLGPWLPSLLLLELSRTACELAGTRAVLGPAAAELSWPCLLRGQLIGQTLDVVMPAGRAASEAAKAAVFAPDVGAPQAAAVATALQLAALVANTIWALSGFVVSRGLAVALPSAVSLSLLGYAVCTSALVLAIALCALAQPVRRWFQRIAFVHATLDRFAVLIVHEPRRLVGAVSAQFLGRACQAAQIAVLGAALGGRLSLPGVMLGQAVYLVGAAFGDLVPAQLGATDAAFVFSAAAFGLTPSAAMALSLAMHAVQVMTAATASIAALLLWLLEQRHAAAHASTALDHQRGREFG